MVVLPVQCPVSISERGLENLPGVVRLAALVVDEDLQFNLIQTLASDKHGVGIATNGDGNCTDDKDDKN